MAPDLNGPADMSMMRIVHTALRRDIVRAQLVLTDLPYPDRGQRMALCAHLRWMMGWLQHHHETEDAQLYPMVREANPDAARLLDDMDADHAAIQPAMTAVEDAVARYALAPEAREELVSALAALSDVLLPHLRREEDEAMPVVSASLSERQWRDLDHEHNVKPLSTRELAFTGLWIVDGLSAEDEAIVAALVPPIPRWIIRHVLVHGYRKAMFKCWRMPEHTSLKIRLSGRTSQQAEASPETVWQILQDITRVGEWSHECHTAAWIDGSTHATVGARFRGTNRSGYAQWSRSCTVHRCNAPHEFGYRTEGRLLRDSTEWLWTLHPEGTGTRIEQHYRIRRLPAWADRLLWLLTPAHHDRRPALATDLQRLAALAERAAAPTDTAHLASR
jgi:iron-sulfur cluster repair protein YtfE (RIC family)